jgi:hypothetical protein
VGIARVTIRQELGKGMEVARQFAATILGRVNSSTQYALLCCPKFDYNVDCIEAYSAVAVGGATNTLDVFKDTGSPVAIMTQFDPDTIVAGAAPVEKPVLATGKSIPAGTPLYMKLVIGAVGSATAPPDVNVVVHVSPDIKGYDSELSVGTYE